MGRSRFKITHSPVFISQRYIYICKSEPMISMIYYFYLTDSKVIQFRPKAKKLTGFTWYQALRQVLRFDSICQQVGHVRSNQRVSPPWFADAGRRHKAHRSETKDCVPRHKRWPEQWRVTAGAPEGPSSHREVTRARWHLYAQWVAQQERIPQPRKTKSLYQRSSLPAPTTVPEKDRVFILLDGK